MVEALKNHCHKTPSLCDLGTRCWCTFATKLDHLSATKQNWYLFANIEPGAPGCGKQPNNANICFILLTQIHIICFQTVGKPDALDLNQMVKYSQHLTFSWKIKVYLKLLLAHMNNDFESQQIVWNRLEVWGNPNHVDCSICGVLLFLGFRVGNKVHRPFHYSSHRHVLQYFQS